ncbi:hypothetical protein [Microcoleus sp. FACHB-68]|uniref:hypothetical protein n=1 Tax=Microcoleus sp. FACHB-68 TaxID=2692826 RepID=UPI001683F5B0|nr:hypothetical protein [Microcoleus sp. FACHB-68]MBD1938490.1 hypothetical protein [Microcoleus sp. FACHB-68]
MISHLHRFLSAPLGKSSSPLVFWLTLSLTFAVIYSFLGLQQAFGSEYVVQDDAVQHVFWMQRFIDPQLFPNDWIANYYQSSAPAGYSAFYRLFATLGVNPLFFSKILPFALVLLTTGYCFACVMEILPVPAAGFIATLLLNQNLWMKDDIASATPRAFLYPLFLAFLYYLMRRSLFPCLAAIALQGLFYPQCVLISAGVLILQLVRWEGWRPRLCKDRRDFGFVAAGLGMALVVMLPYALEASEFGPVVTGAQARTMLEFSKAGRSDFFRNHFSKFWLWGDRSGFFPREWYKLPHSYFLILLGVGLLLPVLLKFPSRFPLATQITKGIAILPQILLVSTFWFIASHALLFKLYLPSRYTQHNLRMLMALSAGIAVTVLLDALFSWAKGKREKRGKFSLHRFPFFPPLLALSLTVLLGATFILYPSSLKKFPRAGYEVGKMPELYQFFQQQPKDITIASLTGEASNIPTFTKRSVLTAREYAIPYHTRYYAEIRQRTSDLIRAQYSPDPKQVRSFIEKYGIDFWLIDAKALKPEYFAFLEEDDSHTSIWIKQYEPAYLEAKTRVQQGAVPALAGVTERCSVLQPQGLVVLQAECIVNSIKN